MVEPPKLPHPRYYASPVDYEAWGKGYMPPSEHILIDQLMFRGARVIQSTDSGKPDGPAYWLVIRGKTNPKKVALALAKLMADWEDGEWGTAVAAEAPVESGDGVGAISDEGNPATDDPLIYQSGEDNRGSPSQNGCAPKSATSDAEPSGAGEP